MAKVTKGKLNDRQRAFVDEYLVDLNATRAYLRAGYDVKRRHSAEAAGSALLRNLEVATAIRVALDERGKRTEVTADRVVEELYRLAFFDPALLTNVHGPEDIPKLPEWVRRAIVGWDWKGKDASRFVIKFHKEAALALLAQHTGVTTPKVEIGGAAGNGTLVLKFVPAVPPPAKGK